MNSELLEGMTDGSFKKVVADRGGSVEGTTNLIRKALHDTWYGIHEVAQKPVQDGRVVETEDFVNTPTAVLN
jgi:hypothetical protein